MKLTYHSKCGPLHPVPWVRLIVSLLATTLLFLAGWGFRLKDLLAWPNALQHTLIFFAVIPLSVEWFYYWHTYYAYRYLSLDALRAYMYWQYSVGYVSPAFLMIVLYAYVLPVWLGQTFPDFVHLLVVVGLYSVFFTAFGAYLVVKSNRYSLKYQTSMVLYEGGKNHTVNLLDIDVISQKGGERIFRHADGNEFVSRPRNGLKELADTLDPYYFFFAGDSIINRKAVNNHRVFVVDEDGKAVL